MGINLSRVEDKKPTNEIGILEMDNCCVGKSYMTFTQPCCSSPKICPDDAPPAGPEWDSAKEGFAALQNEAESICNEAPKFCKCAGVTWPCPCGDAFQEKAFLDKAGWDDKANLYLAKHGLRVQSIAYIDGTGKNSKQHLQLRFFKTSGEAPLKPAKEVKPAKELKAALLQN